MPNKLTDSEIVKALECCCIKKNCNGCPQYSKTRCLESACKGAVDLINRLQARVEYYKKNRNKYQDDVMYLAKQLDNLQAENERLKAKVNHYAYLYDNFVTKPTNRIKAEAYKEFAEEIFELFPADKCNTVISRVTVKHILKELVGEDK